MYMHMKTKVLSVMSSAARRKHCGSWVKGMLRMTAASNSRPCWLLASMDM